MTRDWMCGAACRGVNPELFFPSSTGNGARQQVAEAARVCADCPVARECAEYADSQGIPHGVWGGRSRNAIGEPLPRGALHGTPRGYAWHLRRQDTPCDECKAAHADRCARYYAERRAKTGRQCPVCNRHVKAVAGLIARHNDNTRRKCPGSGEPYAITKGDLPPLDWAKCGTEANAAAHRRRGETPCDECRAAETRVRAVRKARGRA